MLPNTVLEVSHSLAFDPSEHARLLVDGDPWLEVIPAVADGVAGEVELAAGVIDGSAVSLSLAGSGLSGVRGAGFADPQVAWSIRPVVAELETLGVVSFGYQYMEFALPSAARADGLGLAPWPLRPPAAMPLLWGGAGRPALLLGPLNHPHESVIVVPSEEFPRDDIRAGWHGDLETVDELVSEFVLIVADDARQAMARYGEMVRGGAGALHGARATDAAVRGLSYWTDNGATYYYRPAPERTYAETLGAVVDALAAEGLPMHAVQLDSWWYPHVESRGLGEGAAVVPPSGALRWEPRDDALPGGFAPLHAATGGLPLVLHSRHLAASSSYFAASSASGDDGGFAAFRDGESGHAHPAAPDLLDAWMEQAASWGACTYEQDWLVEIFLTVGGLRHRPGRAGAWLDGMDRSAARRGLTLQLCMASPADFLHAATMAQVSSIRTSMDYRYLADRQGNWGWFLHVNALARALGLAASKDVFVTTDDPYADVEVCLAALSCGPVGIGDPIGEIDRDLVARTCREDGILVQPDLALAALARSFFAEPMGSSVPLAAECWSEHPAGRWHYVVGCAVPEASARLDVGLDDLDGPVGAHLARRDLDGVLVGLVDRGDTFPLDPADGPLDLWVVAPLLLDGSCAVFGDVSKFASAGCRRVGAITECGDEVSFLVLGVAHSEVVVSGWGVAPEGARVDDSSGAWESVVGVGPNGWTRVSIRRL